MYSAIIAVLFALAVTVQARVELIYPPPFHSQFNPNTNGSIDVSANSPLSSSSPTAFPCNGYQSDLGTPAGASVSTWSAGETYNITFRASIYGPPAQGGSCQVSISYDNATTFKVLKSIIGNCPTQNSTTFTVFIPYDAPCSESAIIAFTQFPQYGNREMYMHCAPVTITKGDLHAKAKSPFFRLPDIFVANVMSTSCSTVESTEVFFPSINGADLIIFSNNKNRLETWRGDCGPVDLKDPRDPETDLNPIIPVPSDSPSATHSTPQSTVDVPTQSLDSPSTMTSDTTTPTPTAHASGALEGPCNGEKSNILKDGTIQFCVGGNWAPVSALSIATPLHPFTSTRAIRGINRFV